MNGSADRDRLDQALTSALGGMREPGGAECPDAAILASYVEHSLAAVEAAELDAHLAICSRCQAALGAVARAAPQDDPGERRLVAEWLAPAMWMSAAFAATLIVVLLLRPSQTVEVASVPSANRTPIAAPSAMELAMRERESGVPAQLRAAPAALPTEVSIAKQAAPTPLRRDEALNAFTKAERLTAPIVRAPPKPAAAGASVGIAAAPQSIAATAPSAIGAAAESSASVGYAPSREKGIAMRARPLSNRATVVAETGGSAANVRGARSALVVESPDRSVTWRVEPGGAIFRTRNGQTWQVHQLAAGIELSAGSAPSASICWLAGKRGLVMRTLNGERWEKLIAPTPADLDGIAAANAESATVTSSDGTRFATSDGGKSWQQL